MLRCLFTIASVMSLLLFVASAALWVRSYFVFDSVEYSPKYSNGDRVIHADSNWGALSVCLEKWPFDRGEGDGWTDQTMEPGRPDSSGGFLGFGRTWVYLQDYDGTLVATVPLCTFPDWALLTIFGLTPAFIIGRRARRRRIERRGCCASCGYDLRASTERCPECGSPIPPKAETSA